MKTRELQTLWWDWLGTSERLLRTLHEQTAALTLRDVARIERLQPDLDSLLDQMRQTDDRAAACARKLAEDLGTEPQLRSLVRALEQAEAQQVQALANRVMVTARNVQTILDRNRQLIESELAYVNGTLTLVAKVASENKSAYTRQPIRAAVVVDAAA
ncbi:MAG: flagellar export chaperone FlgN [Armatimonadetes bacterium]|nr:flagellar export chaperone FlgN [Armatimonadota bacterium]